MHRAIRSAADRLGRLPHPVLIGIALLLVAAIVLISYAIRMDIRFSFFYLVPIALTSWFVGRRTGIAFAFLSAAVWFVERRAEHGSSHREIVVAEWNTFLFIGFFLLFSVLLSTLAAALEREKASARSDALTRIANRRSFFELASAEIERAARYGGRFSVVYMDLDNFKQVNDRDGQETGDRVLVLAAEAIGSSLRVNDLFARIGGDEFILLLPETGSSETDVVFRKLANRLAEAMKQGHWPVTLSAGAVTFERPPESVEQMVKLVDELMYAAKTGGRDRLAKRIIEK